MLRLTELAHGGGCGCKIAPNLLKEILHGAARGSIPPALLVGMEHADDAAVWQLNDEQALVATTDFFTPIVDDPRDFGRIAAANAISDIYAMGGTPMMALAILGIPTDQLDAAVVREILDGGGEICARAGIPVAGGHSIDSPEPIYGLTVIGTVHPRHIKTNGGARVNDVLILGKPLGIGILSAAGKQQRLTKDEYAELLSHTLTLNSVGALLGQHDDVHAMTDVTGFGLGGHLLEMLRASNALSPHAPIGAKINYSQLPLLNAAEKYAQAGLHTGASIRNWQSYGNAVKLQKDFPIWARHLLCDPQTSGGLLVSCASESASSILKLFHHNNCPQAAVIGHIVDGLSTIEICIN